LGKLFQAIPALLSANIIVPYNSSQLYNGVGPNFETTS